MHGFSGRGVQDKAGDRDVESSYGSALSLLTQRCSASHRCVNGDWFMPLILITRADLAIRVLRKHFSECAADSVLPTGVA